MTKRPKKKKKPNLLVHPVAQNSLEAFMLSKRNSIQKNYNSRFYTILENASRCRVTEGRSVVAEGNEGLKGRLQGVADMFLILYTVMVS